MAHEVVMPQLGLSMDSGAIIQWLKQTGDRVEAGDLLLEVESEKATIEVEAAGNGTLFIQMNPEDGDIAVGTVIAYLLAEGEAAPLSAGRETGVPVAASGPRPAAATPATETAREGPRDRPPSSPAARRRARELGVDWQTATGTGRGGRIKERDVVYLAAELEAEVVPIVTATISPVALRLAEAVGIHTDELVRRYPTRRIERPDVEQFIREKLAGLDKKDVAPPKGAERPSHRQPMSRLRRIIADRMANSAHTTAPVTLNTEADATDLVRMREGLKSDPQIEVAPSYNAMFAKLAATALLEHPDLNASIDGDEVVYWETANVAIAVETEHGLVVPVVNDVQTKPILDLAIELSGLLSRAKQGRALPDELTGSTFTITNLGAFDVDGFTPIINPPECAVLGVGRLAERMVVLGGAPVVRTMVTLSLTFDHRLVDGAQAARFLQRIKQFVEQPYLWLL